MNVNWNIAEGEEPILLSRNTHWTDVNINHWRVMPGEIPEHQLDCHEITIPLAGKLVTERHTGLGISKKVFGSREGVCLANAGQILKASWKAELEIVTINFKPGFITKTALENNFSPYFEFTKTYETKDKLIRYLGLALLEEAVSGSIAGSLYTESLSQTLMIHLLKHYSTANSRQENLSGGLSGYKLRRISEFINENLGGTLTLGEIAEVAGLSQFHFLRVFQQTTGLTPQQYVMQKRIEKAKQLLAVSDLPLVEISMQTGFKNQSHFTTLFRKFTKHTPGRWRELKHV